MKTNFFMVIIALVLLNSCTTSSKVDYLVLNADQLKPLGIELNQLGVFYKNVNPAAKEDHRRYAGLAFYCVKGNYLNSKHFELTDTLKATNADEKLLVAKEQTQFDFYPILIGTPQGNQSLDEDIPLNMKLLPVAICMSDAKLAGRSDTIVAWFKPTESLSKALPSNIKMEDYLKTRP